MTARQPLVVQLGRHAQRAHHDTLALDVGQLGHRKRSLAVVPTAESQELSAHLALGARVRHQPQHLHGVADHRGELEAQPVRRRVGGRGDQHAQRRLQVAADALQHRLDQGRRFAGARRPKDDVRDAPSLAADDSADSYALLWIVSHVWVEPPQRGGVEARLRQLVGAERLWEEHRGPQMAHEVEALVEEPQRRAAELEADLHLLPSHVRKIGGEAQVHVLHFDLAGTAAPHPTPLARHVGTHLVASQHRGPLLSQAAHVQNVLAAAHVHRGRLLLDQVECRQVKLELPFLCPQQQVKEIGVLGQCLRRRRILQFLLAVLQLLRRLHQILLLERLPPRLRNLVSPKLGPFGGGFAAALPPLPRLLLGWWLFLQLLAVRPPRALLALLVRRLGLEVREQVRVAAARLEEAADREATGALGLEAQREEVARHPARHRPRTNRHGRGRARLQGEWNCMRELSGEASVAALEHDAAHPAELGARVANGELLRDRLAQAHGAKVCTRDRHVALVLLQLLAILGHLLGGGGGAARREVDRVRASGLYETLLVEVVENCTGRAPCHSLRLPHPP